MPAAPSRFDSANYLDVGHEAIDPLVLEGIASKVEKGIAITNDDVRAIRSLLAENPKAIPYLDRSLWNNHTKQRQAMVVRHVGMVQDMLETEYYISHTTQGVSTHFREIYSHVGNQTDDLQSMVEHIAERQPLVVVSIPFTSTWFNNMAFGPATNNVPGELMPSSNATTTAKVTPERSSNKRERDVDDMDTTCKRQLSHGDEDNTSRPSSCSSGPNTSNADWWPAGCMKSNVQHCPVLAKMYYDHPLYEPNGRRLRLNDIVELIGVISPPPAATGNNNDNTSDGDRDMDVDDAIDDEEEEEEPTLVVPPPELLPRFHVLVHHVLDLDAMTRDSTTAEVIASNASHNLHEPSVQRADAIDGLATLLFHGDSPAAEALLMAMLSQAERERNDEHTWGAIKTPNDASLGCASLNLVTSNATHCHLLFQNLYQVLQQIAPAVAAVDASDPNWTTPRKDASGRLIPSSLQLSKGSTLLINLPNQHSLSPSMLETLKTLTGCHSVSYHFGGFFKYMMEADYRIIVVSTKSLTSCLMSVRVNNDDATPFRMSDDQQPLLKRIRLYLALRRSTGGTDKHRISTNNNSNNIALSPEVLVQAQQDFVHRRNAVCNDSCQTMQEPPQVQEEDLNRWLTVTRLQARSRCQVVAKDKHHQQAAATVEDWSSALRLDDAIRPLSQA